MLPVAAIIATAALALLAAACGGGPSSSPNAAGSGGSPNTSATSGSTTSGSGSSPLVAFSQCVRSRGVPNFPDPPAGASNAKFPGAQQLGVGSSQLDAAESACEHLLPAGVDDQFPAAEVPVLLSGMRQFSQCMRSHGVPNWPDPSTDSQGRPVFDLSDHGFSRAQAHSTQLEAKMNECQHLLPSALGGIPLS
jgi:hypothetical protein